MIRIPLVCLIASGVVAGLLIVLNRGFGIGDLWAFMFWSILFAVLVGLVSTALARFPKGQRTWVRYVIAGVSGAVLGWGWTLLVALFLGPWFAAFSFPVLACWVAGGSSGMVAGIKKTTKPNKSITLIQATIISAICLSSLGIEPLLVAFSKGQSVEVIGLKWEPGPEPLSVQDGVSDRDLSQLKSIGLSGRLREYGSGTFGRGKPSRVLILMQHQLDKPVDLPEPDGVEVIYIQEEHSWKMYPADAPILSRVIRLWPDESNPQATRYWVELADGARQGGTILTW